MTEETMHTQEPGYYLGKVVNADDVPSNGISGSVEADPGERADIADALDLVSLDSLAFTFTLLPAGKNKYALTGTLKASLMQRCVVTLEPVKETLSVDAALEFWPGDELSRLEEAAGDAAENLELDGPEPFDGEKIDIGRLAYEILASNLDPYPRRKDASLDWADTHIDAAEQSDSPFAALKTLDTGKN